MPNISSFGAQTDNSVVQGTVTDRAMVIPDVPPSGLMSVGPRVTPHFVKPSLWSALTTYHFFDAVHDAAGASYVAIKPEVPAGTELTDEGYWFLWADPNSQFADLSELVKTFNGRITQNTADIAKIKEKYARTYASVAEMEVDASAKAGMIVQTASFYEGKDTGGAWYLLKKADPEAPANGKDTIACQNGINAVLLNVDEEIIPEQYGAHGDLSADDTNVLQYCIDLGIADHKPVKMFGRYATSTPLKLKSKSALVGGYTNDEYSSTSLILNSTTDIFSLQDDVIGAQIKGFCFDKASKTNDGYFINSTHTLKWCEFSNCGFRNFDQVFNVTVLGCRFYNFWINHGNRIGTFAGSDCVFKDWFASSLAEETNRGTMLAFGGFSLSRCENLYLTGADPSANGVKGCNTIVSIGSYSQNLSFIGCYFDYSFGPALNVKGSGNDFPTSGCTGITFDGCLFRSNCMSQNTVSHAINVELTRGLTLRSCYFGKPKVGREPNADSKLYNFTNYAQNVRLDNNHYIGTSKTNVENAEWRQRCDFDVYDSPSIGMGFVGKTTDDNSTNVINIQNVRLVETTQTLTTDSQYGAVTVNFSNFSKATPHYFASVKDNSNLICTINKEKQNSVELIIRKVFDGSPVVNTSVTINCLAIGFGYN